MPDRLSAIQIMIWIPDLDMSAIRMVPLTEGPVFGSPLYMLTLFSGFGVRCINVKEKTGSRP